MVYTDIVTRALVVTLKLPLGGRTTVEIAEKTGLNPRTINRIYTKAIERRFDLNQLPLIIKDEYLKDILHSRRLTKQTSEFSEQIQSKVYLNQYRREKSCTEIAGEL